MTPVNELEELFKRVENLLKLKFSDVKDELEELLKRVEHLQKLQLKDVTDENERLRQYIEGRENDRDHSGTGG